MKNLIRLEEFFQFVLAIVLVNQLPFPGWWYAAFFLAPDLSMLGYLINPQVGALLYNIVHHKAVGIVIYLAGVYFNIQELTFIGLLLFGHSAFDRMFGYGLKYSDSFIHTHLGMIGKSKNQ